MIQKKVFPLVGKTINSLEDIHLITIIHSIMLRYFFLFCFSNEKKESLVLFLAENKFRITFWVCQREEKSRRDSRHKNAACGLILSRKLIIKILMPSSHDWISFWVSFSMRSNLSHLLSSLACFRLWHWRVLWKKTKL